MKKEEAIERLKQNKAAAEFYVEIAQNIKLIENELKDIEAFDMAIEALQAETIPLSVADKIGEEREQLQDKVAELQEEITEPQEKIIDRPHGEWIEEYTDANGDKWYRCSHCGERFVLIEKGEASAESYHFCPICCADMRKRRET